MLLLEKKIRKEKKTVFYPLEVIFELEKFVDKVNKAFIGGKQLVGEYVTTVNDKVYGIWTSTYRKTCYVGIFECKIEEGNCSRIATSGLYITYVEWCNFIDIIRVETKTENMNNSLDKQNEKQIFAYRINTPSHKQEYLKKKMIIYTDGNDTKHVIKANYDEKYVDNVGLKTLRKLERYSGNLDRNGRSKVLREAHEIHVEIPGRDSIVSLCHSVLLEKVVKKYLILDCVCCPKGGEEISEEGKKPRICRNATFTDVMKVVKNKEKDIQDSDIYYLYNDVVDALSTNNRSVDFNFDLIKAVRQMLDEEMFVKAYLGSSVGNECEELLTFIRKKFSDIPLQQ